jgi:hypothetical protein
VNDALHACQVKQLGAVLLALIRDLHTSIAAGRDDGELLDLAVLLHTQGGLAVAAGSWAPESTCAHWTSLRPGRRPSAVVTRSCSAWLAERRNGVARRR